jgi:PAS domain S-box-containing protein
MAQDGWRMEHRVIPGYTVDESLSVDNSWQLFRAVRIVDNLPVLIRAIRSQSPEPYYLDQLGSEFDTLRDMDIAGVLKAHDLLADADGALLIMEDPGGTLLSVVLESGRLEINNFLNIASQLTSTIAELHGQGIAHTQLRPDLVFLGENWEGVWISGFYHALNLNGDGPVGHVSSDGTLAYIAPEQTGRIDAEIDHRTDLYLLGVLFYEMLTGKPPFEALDPLELIHSHLARIPIRPCDVDSKIPGSLSDMVMRLLMKKPDERYKSAHGVLADLRECEMQYRRTGTIVSFTLAQSDRLENFEIPEKLYGRAEELKQLLDVFDQVRQGGSKLVLVAGYSGVGKTSLIQHIRGSVVEKKAYFVSGKYDQLERSNPYSAILQAFLELVKQILTETDADIEMWKQRILAAVGVNAQVVIDVIPELELIIGKQPPVPELKPAESQNRFNFYFQNFITALARPERPLVLFLDDLQWASVASIRLFQSWVTGINVNGLLMIGAYRNNEVDATHPLRSVIRELRDSGGRLNEIDLQPLDIDSINKIIQDTLGGSADESLPLASCVHQKTDGNPFYARAFLRSLYEEDQLSFDHKAARWNWDVDAINTVSAADNVVDLMARKIKRLPKKSRDVIQLAACIGNRFALPTLATACGQGADKTLQQLEQVISDGLIEQQDERFLTFYHDRVQEAAYRMILQPQREKIHYQIGSLLQASVNEAELDEQIFEIVNHLNHGSALIPDSSERSCLAELNLRAGLKAKSSTAFGSAYAYFSKGIELLPSNPWKNNYKLAFDLHREYAESAYLSAKFEEAEQGFSLLMEKARSKREQGIIYNLRMVQYENLSRFAEAAALGREGVALFDIHFPDTDEEKLAQVDMEIEAIQDKLVDKPIMDLVHLPVMQDPDVKICMKLLMTMWAPNYISGDIPMTMLIAACMVRLSLEYGNAEESAYGYVTHGINVAARTDDHARAYEYGQLALSVNHALDDRTVRAKVNHMFSCYIGPWRDHIKESFKYSRAGYEAGIESGDFTYGGYSGFQESWHALFSGMELERYIEEYSAKLQFLSGNQYQSIADAHQLMLQWGRCLQGKTDAPLLLDGNDFTEQAYLDAYQDVPFFIAFYYVAKLNISFLMQDYQAAMHFAERADKVIFGVRGMIWDAWLCFYHALALAAVSDSLNPDQKAAALEKIGSLSNRMRIWADNAPQNFAQQYELIEAEVARLNGNPDDAATHYEHAIELAREHEFINIEALASQLAGKFWLQRGRQSIATAYLRDSAGRYRQWGAHGITAQLNDTYHDLIAAHESQISGVSDSSPGSLDIAAILKASQAISGEMIMDQLVERLMQIVLEDAGAERGLLLCPDGGGWRVDATGAVDDGDISLNISLADSSSQIWSSGVVNYVNHTREYLLSGDAQQDNRLIGDHYIRDQSIRSVLCVPILQQQELTAMLYLENNLMTNAFTKERVLVVQALAAQAAIALKNARLYSDVVKEISERRQAESALRAIASGTASVTGGDFFHSLVQSLAVSLQVKRIFVAECIGSDRRRVRTLAFMNDGNFEENIEFDLSGTPCEAVVQGSACYHPDNLEKLYPREKGFESYIGAPALDLSGRVLGHLAIFDTTDMRHLPHAESIIQIFATRVGVELHRKRTQEALQASEEKYRLLVENQTDLVIKIDQNGCLQFVSPSYCEMFSRSESDLQGSSFHQQVHASDRERIEFEWQKLNVAPWIAQLEHRVVVATGERWLGWALKALRDDSGEVIEIVGVGRDVTDRRKAEEQARQHLHTLAHAGRMHSMGEMASTLAHELNQPLTAILSFSQASQRVIKNQDYDHDELENALQRIAVNAKRAGDIISHMRGFIRKEEPHTELSDINRLIREAIELVNSELLQLEIDVVFNQQESLPDVAVDPIHIQQVILNLVRNSMEAIEQHSGGKRRISITTRMHKPGGIEVSITDTGPGLDAAIADKIFNTFATTKPEGMGVGLSICKSIIEAHGGELAIRQDPGSGATFSFVLPTAGE